LGTLLAEAKKKREEKLAQSGEKSLPESE